MCVAAKTRSVFLSNEDACYINKMNGKQPRKDFRYVAQNRMQFDGAPNNGAGWLAV
jgi:hypothetical protein